MANVYVSNIAVPRTVRNKRIYGGNSFVSQNQQTIGGGAAAKHFEHGRLTNLVDRMNFIIFTIPFTRIPTMLQFKVYRMTDIGVGKIVMEDVLHDHTLTFGSWISETACNFTIDDRESLTGVIVEYCFTE